MTSEVLKLTRRKLSGAKRLKIQEWARLHNLRSLLMEKNVTDLGLEMLPKLQDELDKRIAEVTPLVSQ